MKKYIKYLLALTVMVIMFVPLSTRAEQSNGLIYEYDEYSDGIYISQDIQARLRSLTYRRL